MSSLDPIDCPASELREGMIVDLLYALEQFGDMTEGELAYHPCQFEFATVIQNSVPLSLLDGRDLVRVYTDQGVLPMPAHWDLPRLRHLEDVVEPEEVEPEEVEAAIRSIRAGGP